MKAILVSMVVLFVQRIFKENAYNLFGRFSFEGNHPIGGDYSLMNSVSLLDTTFLITKAFTEMPLCVCQKKTLSFSAGLISG